MQKIITRNMKTDLQKALDSKSDKKLKLIADLAKISETRKLTRTEKNKLVDIALNQKDPLGYYIAIFSPGLSKSQNNRLADALIKVKDFSSILILANSDDDIFDVVRSKFINAIIKNKHWVSALLLCESKNIKLTPRQKIALEKINKLGPENNNE